MEMLKAFIWRIIVNKIAASALVPSRLRAQIWRAVGVTVGSHPHLAAHCILIDPDVTLKNSVLFNVGVTVVGRGGVLIGNGVQIGTNVLISTSSHEIGDASKRAGEVIDAPVVIGDGCWIGASATIMHGVTVGEGSIVGAGALVTRDLPANGVYVGVPARRQRQLPSGRDK